MKKGKKTAVRKNLELCKADFPKSNVLTKETVVVCRGLARRFKLRVRGRRNAFGLWQGQRSDIWQSGTTPSLAVHFRSNSHTMPNYRVPLTQAIHAAVCTCPACQKQSQEMLESLTLKTVSKIAQRVQRESTGYYCGYTFKGQAIGRKYLLKASKSLDYLTDALENKTAAQRMHHITNKCFSDMFHRCCSRPTAEEWNLAAFWHPQDVTNAEFQRTWRSVAFPGAQLVHRLEHEMSSTAKSTVTKLLPPPKDATEDASNEVIIRHFPDLYGFRGPNTGKHQARLCFCAYAVFLSGRDCIHSHREGK